MLELFHESLKAPNLPATFLLLLVLVFWIISLIGLVDLDLQADVNVDADLHKEIHGPSSGGGSFLNSTLQFFHVGEIPVTILLSFFALFFWMGCILTNHYLGNSSIWIGLVLMLPNVLLGLVLTKVFSNPILLLYRKLNSNDEEHISDYSGSTVFIHADASPDHMGQGEINLKGDSIKVYVKTLDGELHKGQTALLIEYKKEKGYYIAAPYENPA